MKSLLLLLFLIIYSKNFAQRLSAGILIGENYNYELVKTHTSNPNYFNNTIDSNPKLSFGFFVEKYGKSKINLGLQVKLMKIVQNTYQDSLGNPTLTYGKSEFIFLNLTPYINYNFNSHWKIFAGISYDVLLTRGLNFVVFPTYVPRNYFAIPLKEDKSVIGVEGGIAYQKNRFKIELGYNYPFMAISESLNRSYYVPSVFLQIKYDLLPFLLRKKI